MAVQAGATRPDRIRLTVVTLGGGDSEKESPPFLFKGNGLGVFEATSPFVTMEKSLSLMF
jgi:hypothetical protein